MKPELLQQLFGTETAKVYLFDGTVPEGADVSVYITEEFAKAAGTNLIDCVVTSIQGTNVVYTHTDYQIEDGDFRFYADLPLPEPVIVEEEIPEGPQ